MHSWPVSPTSNINTYGVAKYLEPKIRRHLVKATYLTSHSFKR